MASEELKTFLSYVNIGYLKYSDVIIMAAAAESHSAEAKARSSNLLIDPDGIHKSFWQGSHRHMARVLHRDVKPDNILVINEKDLFLNDPC
ncbi:hypothetical protein WJX82_010602 [Trebouxia sp. C0006]